MPALRYCGSATSSYWIEPATDAVHLDHEQVAVLPAGRSRRARRAPPALDGGLRAHGRERGEIGGPAGGRSRSRGPSSIGVRSVIAPLLWQAVRPEAGSAAGIEHRLRRPLAVLVHHVPGSTPVCAWRQRAASMIAGSVECSAERTRASRASLVGVALGPCRSRVASPPGSSKPPLIASRHGPHAGVDDSPSCCARSSTAASSAERPIAEAAWFAVGSSARRDRDVEDARGRAGDREHEHHEQRGDSPPGAACRARGEAPRGQRELVLERVERAGSASAHGAPLAEVVVERSQAARDVLARRLLADPEARPRSPRTRARRRASGRPLRAGARAGARALRPEAQPRLRRSARGHRRARRSPATGSPAAARRGRRRRSRGSDRGAGGRRSRGSTRRPTPCARRGTRAPARAPARTPLR